jgi:hypothetical protein
MQAEFARSDCPGADLPLSFRQASSYVAADFDVEPHLHHISVLWIDPGRF